MSRVDLCGGDTEGHWAEAVEAAHRGLVVEQDGKCWPDSAIPSLCDLGEPPDPLWVSPSNHWSVDIYQLVPDASW